MSAIIIPVYCGLTGCWQVAKVDGVDELNHPFHACNHDHASQLKAYRAQIYAEGRKLSEYWRNNWGRNAKRA